MADLTEASDAGWTHVPLAGRWTIAEAEDRRTELLTALAQADRLALDTSGVEALDTAGLQLLIALRRSAAHAGKALRLTPPPQGAVLATVTAAGFATLDDAFWSGRA
jgi:anti-anti-sigma regulatory factor